MKRESSVLSVSETPAGSVWRIGCSRALTASVTLIVFSPDARRMSSWTAGDPSSRNSELVVFWTESSV